MQKDSMKSIGSLRRQHSLRLGTQTLSDIMEQSEGEGDALEEDAKPQKGRHTVGEGGLQQDQEKQKARQQQVMLAGRRILLLQREAQNLESKSSQIHDDMMSEFARVWSLQRGLENRILQKDVKAIDKQSLKTRLYELKRSWRFYLNEKVRQERFKSAEKLKELDRERQHLLSSIPELSRIVNWRPRRKPTSRKIQGDIDQEGKVESAAHKEALVEIHKRPQKQRRSNKYGHQDKAKTAKNRHSTDKKDDKHDVWRVLFLI